MANQAHDYDEVTGVNVFFWFICFSLICSLMFICVYSLFTLTDLEADALNPVDACRKLNRVAKYEFFMLVRPSPHHSMLPGNGVSMLAHRPARCCGRSGLDSLPPPRAPSSSAA